MYTFWWRSEKVADHLLHDPRYSIPACFDLPPVPPSSLTDRDIAAFGGIERLCELLEWLVLRDGQRGLSRALALLAPDVRDAVAGRWMTASQAAAIGGMAGTRRDNPIMD